MADAPTRGRGLLEPFLARQRAMMAKRLLPSTLRDGALLDIGCGSQPFFLRQVDVARRVGVDKMVPEGGSEFEGLQLIHHDVVNTPGLPFGAREFDAVTMLAVFEHIPPEPLHRLLVDVRRVLRPGGRLVLTTPAGWTDPILRTLARLGMVSAEEIEEHQRPYDRRVVRQRLEEAGFGGTGITMGTFELRMNLWAVAVR